MDWRQRTARLLGADGLERLTRARVLVAGLGAVGSHAAEALARAGVGTLRLVDFDTLRPTNLNRQLLALRSTLGRSKVAVAAERLADINPSASVEPFERFIHADTLDELLAPVPDLVLDCIDSLNPKVELLAACLSRGVPVLAAMGAANRTDPGRIRTGDVFASEGCPLARFVRKRLRRRGFASGVWCVYSDEVPAGAPDGPDDADAAAGEGLARDPSESRDAPDRWLRGPEAPEYQRGREREVLGSLSTMTGLFGLRLAHEAILRLARGAPDGRPPSIRSVT